MRSVTLVFLLVFAQGVVAEVPRPKAFEPKLWTTCWNAKKGWFDFTQPAWQSLPQARKVGLLKAFQQVYAKAHGVAIERTFTARGAAVEFILIPPGRFRMGSPANEVRRYANETLRTVVVDKPYWMSKYEVTQTQWRQVMGRVPSYFQTGKPKMPVDAVSWDAAQRFCARTGWRLPTEVRWEFACRAGTQTRFYWGHTWDSTKINSASFGTGKDLFKFETWMKFGMNRKLQDYKRGDQLKRMRLGPHPAGSFPSNPLGLYDMLGNLWEWCIEKVDGKAIARGGSWADPASTACRAATRHAIDPNDGSFCLGLRVVRELKK